MSNRDWKRECTRGVDSVSSKSQSLDSLPPPPLHEKEGCGEGVMPLPALACPVDRAYRLLDSRVKHRNGGIRGEGEGPENFGSALHTPIRRCSFMFLHPQPRRSHQDRISSPPAIRVPW